MNGSSVSKATLGRLPLYLQYLRRLPQLEGSTVSATSIAKGLSLGEVQVRKDLASVSGSGKPRVGYVTSELIRVLEDRLGHENITSAVLVGAGKLGCALLDYDGFEEYGVKIVAAFDCNEQIVPTGKNVKEILPIKSLPAYCEEHDVKLGIITVSQSAAQQVCNQLVSSGITAIWNFAPCCLKVPDGVLLKQENLALSLAYLNNQLYK
ncbi:MAG: redox-sensing transcriptional repressor Rex [Clostridia bacterium]|nr:redox-sensing transcriptional repressor Rex [Clostridia bacterium]